MRLNEFTCTQVINKIDAQQIAVTMHIQAYIIQLAFVFVCMRVCVEYVMLCHLGMFNI